MVNKSVSIKNATDPELDALLVRLRKEREVQNLVADLIRSSTKPDPLRPYDYLPITVSTEDSVENLYHNDEVDKVLAHYGVPGMRWGQRKKAARAAQKYADGSDDYKKRVDTKKKPLHTMSNAELKSLNERMNLERQYKDLRKMDISAGRKMVTEILTNAGKETAKNTVAKLMGKAADAGIEKIFKFDAKAAAEAAKKAAKK